MSSALWLSSPRPNESWASHACAGWERAALAQLQFFLSWSGPRTRPPGFGPEGKGLHAPPQKGNLKKGAKTLWEGRETGRLKKITGKRTRRSLKTKLPVREKHRENRNCTSKFVYNIEHRTLQCSTGPSTLDIAPTSGTNLKPL